MLINSISFRAGISSGIFDGSQDILDNPLDLQQILHDANLNIQQCKAFFSPFQSVAMLTLNKFNF